MIKFCFEDSYYHREPELITLCLKNVFFLTEDVGGVGEKRVSYASTLLFARGGSARVFENGKVYAMTDGESAVIASNSTVSIEKSRDCTLYMIDFTCQPDIFSNSESDVTVFLSERDDVFNYVKLYEKFSDGAPIERCEVILLDLLYGLLCSEKRERVGNRLFDGFCRYIREHISEPFGVSDIARELGCSKDHLSRTVKKMSGMTAKEYIVEQRLSAAKVYLSTGDEPIDRVCEQLGFSSAELFNKFLKYHLGKTALVIRKES